MLRTLITSLFRRRASASGEGRQLQAEGLELRCCLAAVTLAASETFGGGPRHDIVDKDGDGDLDVCWLDVYTNRLVWFEYDETRDEFDVSETQLDASLGLRDRRINDIAVADIDGDGDLDFAIADGGHRYQGEVGWYENFDGGSRYIYHLIERSQWGSLAKALSVIARDLDNDGDIDLLTGWMAGAVWYENGGTGQELLNRPIAHDVSSAQWVELTDIDQNGEPDLLATQSNPVGWSSRLAWFDIQSGDAVHVFEAEELGEPTIFRAADLDRDGDVDVIAIYSLSENQSTIVWFESLNGVRQFSEPREIAVQTRWISSLLVTDVDQDGDLDFLTTADQAMSIFENTDGRGEFDLTSYIELGESYPRISDAADIDSDGDIDLFVYDGWTLELFRNLGPVVGDANRDGAFDSSDLVVVFRAGKYETGVAASWQEGDWNRDGVFNSSDLVTAFAVGGYERADAAPAVDVLRTASRGALIA
ncbi:MAG: VCBS repeat-containing protein [Planctomycetales bacterium]|nr:VCBS repeat-containing protein [Planctomycetales bacterium]